MSAPEAKASAAAGAAAHHRDPLQEVALRLYIELCAHVYSAAGGQKPDPKSVVQLAFKLAEAFESGNFEFNSVARAAREAKEKASVNLDAVQIDFGAVGKK